jgi:hypothetical protein
VFEKLHGRIVGIAREKKVVEGRKMRIDTTVTETNIHYLVDMTAGEHQPHLKLKGIAPILGRGIDHIRSIPPNALSREIAFEITRREAQAR